MQIKDLKDKEKVDEIDLKIIWDQSEPKEMFGKQIKAVLVADAESKQGDPTAYFDLVNGDIEKYKFGDKIKVTDAYSKKILGREQFRITNAKKIDGYEG